MSNDNRRSAGQVRGRIVRLELDARLAAWRPDPNVDTTVTVQTFAERGKAPSIPGPFLRLRAGSQVEAKVTNSIRDSTLIIHGLRAGSRTLADDTVQLEPGATRTVRFTANRAGTYLYWGTTSHAKTIGDRWGREGQLVGAVVVDPAAGAAPSDERVFVMTLIDVYPDSSRNPRKEEIWELAINGRSWPHTERLRYDVGETVRWRFVNATDRVHPMHLHGFHFRVLAKGSATVDTTYPTAQERLAVTEFMVAGSTTRLEWVPTRAGNWLMHCHMIPHITPYPDRTADSRAHDSHDVMRHPELAMAGLVLGITTVEPRGRHTGAERETPDHYERLFVQEARTADTTKRTPRGYVLQRGAAPRRDSVEVPGTPLILYRGQTTQVTVVNRLAQPTTVHWHGMELSSIYDGVSGWSGLDSRRAPLVAPGDSFKVAFTPPRAGTYIYHTHMDEEDQLRAGLYAPMIVLEPGERFDPTRDLVFMFGTAVVDGKRQPALNGKGKLEARQLRVGTKYRLRLINIHPVESVNFQLLAGTTPIPWRAISKDGATLPAALQVSRTAPLRMGVGETYDFEWIPKAGGEARLELRQGRRERIIAVQSLIVRE